MPTVDPHKQREFALDVARRLREGGFTALLAGGCVRDELLGVVPKDFDVATDATPEQVRALLGHRRTLAVGASFGVITALGPRGAGQIDVATFRRDESYSDGRHPDAVAFTSAQEDAARRDFTINGLFYDPLAARVIDYVGGQEDLKLKIVRAIGNPAQRFAEDKLRMLRAVRFAATFGFTLETATFEAIVAMAGEIRVVSAERIAMEMRRMLVLPRRRRAVELLVATGLMAAISPELSTVVGTATDPRGTSALAVLERLIEPTFPLALAALAYRMPDLSHVRALCRRWKLTNDETESTHWLAHHAMSLDDATMPWPKLQRLLIHDQAAALVALQAARAAVGEASPESVEVCRAYLAWPPEKLNPPPLITGDDLLAHNVPQGPLYRVLLEQVRDAQLEGQVATRDEALKLVDRLILEGSIDSI
jgi:tRNA nucleotidyltransferase/poly(A) polymerase